MAAVTITQWSGPGLLSCIKSTDAAPIDLIANSLKLMLVKSTFNFTPDLQYVDNAADDASDPSFCECDFTNYVGGFEGAGRKAATVTSLLYDATDNRLELVIQNETWSAAGGTTDNDIGAILLIKEGTDDTDSQAIGCIALNNVFSTNGGDAVLDIDDGDGCLRLSLPES